MPSGGFYCSFICHCFQVLVLATCWLLVRLRLKSQVTLRNILPLGGNRHLPTRRRFLVWICLSGQKNHSVILRLFSLHPSTQRPSAVYRSSLAPMSSSIARYESFLINNVSTISTLESSLRSVTWFLPGRFKDAELASEAR
jgi:hypothetical protein